MEGTLFEIADIRNPLNLSAKILYRLPASQLWQQLDQPYRREMPYRGIQLHTHACVRSCSRNILAGGLHLSGKPSTPRNHRTRSSRLDVSIQASANLRVGSKYQLAASLRYIRCHPYIRDSICVLAPDSASTAERKLFIECGRTPYQPCTCCRVDQYGCPG